MQTIEETARCYHCYLDIPSGTNYQSIVLGGNRAFCCPGCQAIAEMISTNGLESFYQFRTKSNIKPDDILPQELLELESLDSPDVLSSITTQSQGEYQTIELGIEGITCAACGWLIKNQIKKRFDVNDIQVNTTTNRARLKFTKSTQLSSILKNIRELGYRAYPFSEDQQEKLVKAEDRAYSRRLIVAGLAMMQVMMFATGLYIGDFQDISKEHAYFLHLVSGLLATPVVFYSALPFFSSAWKALKHFHFGMNLPISIAIIASYSASIYSLLSNGKVYYFDSVVMFIFFLLVGRFIEHKMRLKAILKQQNFKQLIPLSVNRKNADGTIEVISTAKIKPSDQLIINAGAIVPVDGILLNGTAEVNEAVITGEFMPRKKNYRDSLYSGSENTSASFVMQATTNLADCRVQKLLQLQNNSEHLTSSEVSVADKIANWYVIILLVISLLTGFIWWQIDPSKVFPIILSLLVVSCPCALSLATPAAVAAAIARLTDRGLMIKDKSTLSRLAKINQAFFDKTGTLTLGKMSIHSTLLHATISEMECIQIAANLESISNHPIANAFKSLNIPSLPEAELKEVISGGIEGVINNQTYRIGKKEFVQQQSKLNNIEIPLVTNKDCSNLLIYLTKNNQHIATFILTDELNASSDRALKHLQKLNIETHLISGDSPKVCELIGSQFNFSSIIANVSPEQKLQTIQSAQQKGNCVLMIGDGVNDIGALSQADVGITLGVASHLSRGASNAVLVSQNLTVISEAIQVARKLNRIIRQNLSWAVFYNLIALPFAIMGLIPAWLAAIGMTASSLIVVLNAIRLRR
ncbi:heavy metal translocating P-type ATPase [Aliikangiella sp. IMCC44359]|uniref:heavy metal translocating P-type ATPase n=1 Tax=Aliikangiella sp. IMCC44359 TaxID=3459125 RepID=UPI00403AA5C9